MENQGLNSGGQAGQQVQSPDMVHKFKAERESLNAYRQELLGAYNALKAKEELFTALKEVGIESVKDFEAYKERNGEQAEAKEEIPAEKSGSLLSNEEASPQEAPAYDDSALKKELEALKKQVSTQNYELAKNRVLDQIKESIKDSPEFSMVNRLINDPNQRDIIANNVLRNMEQHRKTYGQEMDLKSALQDVEQKTRKIFETMGGKVDAPAVQKTAPPATPTPYGEVPKPPAPSGIESATQLPAHGGAGFKAPPPPAHEKPDKTGGFNQEVELNEALKEAGIS